MSSDRIGKVRQTIKSFDLFSLPVRLTRKGEVYFSTALGGCCSLLLVVGIVIGAALQFMTVYYEPEFQYLPAEYDFFQKNVTVDLTAN